MANISYGVNVIPKASNTYTLGNSTYKWDEIFVNKVTGAAAATTSEDGLMSVADKTKLDGITTGANKVIIIEYGVSTLQDFIDAYANDAVVLCKCGTSSPSSTPKQRFACLSYIAYNSGGNITSAEFQYYRSIASGSLSSTNAGNEVYIYKLNSSGWSYENRAGGTTISASGTNISVDFSASNRRYTINSTLESKVAASNGTDVSLVTTGEKYTWNNKPQYASDMVMSNSDSTKVGTNVDTLNNTVVTLVHKETGNAASTAITNGEMFLWKGIPYRATKPIQANTTFYTSGDNKNVTLLTQDTFIGELGSYVDGLESGITWLENKMDSILDLVYPVGSIYMSVNQTSPETLFGGTWVQLEDCFLYAGKNDDTTYGPGTSGGNKSVSYTPSASIGTTKLTTDDLPAHTHTVGGHTHGLNSHTHSLNSHTHGVGSYYTESAGSHSHNAIYNGSQNYNLGASLLASGSSYTGVTTGSGISTNSAGSHSHTVKGTSGQASGNTGSASGSTASSQEFNSGSTGKSNTTINAHGHTFTGNSATIATMPPYLAVYMWKRTA